MLYFDTSTTKELHFTNTHTSVNLTLGVRDVQTEKTYNDIYLKPRETVSLTLKKNRLCNVRVPDQDSSYVHIHVVPRISPPTKYYYYILLFLMMSVVLLSIHYIFVTSTHNTCRYSSNGMEQYHPFY